MDNIKLSQANNFVQNVSDLTESLRSNNIPANRIFDTIMVQMKELDEAIHERKGNRPTVEDIEKLEERMEVLASLADVYLTTVNENDAEKENSQSQIETVKRTKEFVDEYEGSIKRYKSILQRNEEVAGEEKDSIAYNKISSITERADFMTELIKKGSESAVSSLKMIEEYADKDEKDLTEQDKKTIRYGMASASMAERILQGGDEVQNLRTHVRRSGEYENLISMVAESSEFKDLTKPICNPKGVEVFLKDENSGRKLWQKFEGKVRNNREKQNTKTLGTKRTKDRKKELKQDKDELKR
ncbi:MAG: hypothetical protein IKO32_12600, partial [Lachnospiraceae bacterium]|nr:hypothetical protein [Lachnospiraceae bacterium]